MLDATRFSQTGQPKMERSFQFSGSSELLNWNEGSHGGTENTEGGFVLGSWFLSLESVRAVGSFAKTRSEGKAKEVRLRRPKAVRCSSFSLPPHVPSALTR